MAKLLVVVGATGFQGRSILTWFQANEPTVRIRGLTRNPSSAAATALANNGVEIVQADLNDLASLKAAFQNANYIFAHTDFATIVNGPSVMGKFLAGDLAAPISAEAYKIEVQQGKNVADAAAGIEGLRRLVWSSLPDVKGLSKGKYDQVAHFDSKAVVTEYMLRLKALEGKVSMAMFASFMSNIKNSKKMFGFSMLEGGTALWRFPAPADMLYPWVDVEKDAGPFVKALINAPAPTHVLIVSEWMTSQDWLDLWSKTTGVKARYEEPSAEDFIGEDPSGLLKTFYQTLRAVAEFGYTCGDPIVVMPEELEKKGMRIPRSSNADYIAREDWSEVIGKAPGVNENESVSSIA